MHNIDQYNLIYKEKMLKKKVKKNIINLWKIENY